jgi:hypothetical protein
MKVTNDAESWNMGVQGSSGSHPDHFRINRAGSGNLEFMVTAGGNVEIPNGNLDMSGNDINDVGTLNADTKNFVQLVNETHEAVYTSQESVDARAVVEGTGRMVEGRGVVELPRHFVQVVSEERPGLTVQVTPHSAETQGLAVTEKGREMVVVEELAGGSNTFTFDFRVTGIREGYEDKRVVRHR